jgi:hypothetical protein
MYLASLNVENEVTEQLTTLNWEETRALAIHQEHKERCVDFVPFSTLLLSPRSLKGIPKDHQGLAGAFSQVTG